MSGHSDSTAIEMLEGVKAKIVQSRAETLARLETLEHTISPDHRQAISMLARMRRSADGFDACLTDINELIADIQNGTQ